MNNKIVSNQDKYYTYKELMGRLKKAKEMDANFEILVITYALIEDRTKSLCRYMNIKFPQNKIVDLYTKTQKINENISNNQVLNKMCDKDLFDRLHTWRRSRNDIIHSLADCFENYDTYEDMANEGIYIVKQLNKLCTNYKRKCKIENSLIEFKNKEDIEKVTLI